MDLTIFNPIPKIHSIPELLSALLIVCMVVVIPVIIFFFMLAGFNLVTAQGNEAKITKAKNALWYGIIGTLMIIGATAITTILKNLVNAFMS